MRHSLTRILPYTPRQLFELVGDANREELPGAAETVRDMLAILGLESIAHPEEGAGEDAETEPLS